MQLKANTASHGCDRSAQGMAYLFRPLLKHWFYLFAPSTILSFGCKSMLCLSEALLGLRSSSAEAKVLKAGGAEISPADSPISINPVVLES